MINAQPYRQPSAQENVLPLAASVCDYPRRTLSKGDILYREGDTADTVFRVEAGLLKLSLDLITGKERILNIVGPGDFVGAITPSHSAQQETVTALSQQVDVRVIPADELAGDLQHEVYAAAGVQLARLRHTLEDSELPVPARLARTFVRLGERFGHVGSDRTVHLTLPLTHDNLAAMVGAARETTTAVVGDMRNEGLINGTRGRYHFNMDTLQDYALEAAFAY